MFFTINLTMASNSLVSHEQILPQEIYTTLIQKGLLPCIFAPESQQSEVEWSRVGKKERSNSRVRRWQVKFSARLTDREQERHMRLCLSM